MVYGGLRLSAWSDAMQSQPPEAPAPKDPTPTPKYELLGSLPLIDSFNHVS